MSDEKLNRLAQSLKKWEEENAGEFAREQKREFISESGIPVKRFYTPLDLAEKGFDYETHLGFPGQYPCTRGDSATMYRSGLWAMSQIAGHANLEESNAMFRRLIADGLRAIVVAPDMPNQFGYDPGDPQAAGEVGRVGLSLSSLKDFEVALEGIKLDDVVISYAGFALAALNVAEHLSLADRQGVPWANALGYLQNDILKEFAARGNYIFPVPESMRLAVDVIEFCVKHAPKYSPLVVTSYHYEEKGANPVHEMAYMLADLIAYMEACVKRGLDIDQVAPKVKLHTAISHIDFFGEVAKLRATRRLWAKIMKERFGAKDPKSMVCRMLPLQAGTSVYREQYLNNIARSAIAILGAALVGGGRNEPRTFDEMFGIPTEESIRTALRVQQIIGYETGVCDTVDPLAGSYYVETLTCELEERIQKEIEAVEAIGGAVEAIEKGYIQRRVARDGYEKEQALLTGKVTRVGVNRFRSEGEEDRPLTSYRADFEYEKKRIEDIRKLRRERPAEPVKQALDKIRKAASAPEGSASNVMPHIIEAVKAYATRGEITGVLREVWGECREPAIL